MVDANRRITVSATAAGSLFEQQTAQAGWRAVPLPAFGQQLRLCIEEVRSRLEPQFERDFV